MEVKKIYGDKNLILTTLHMDESNVHMHTLFFKFDYRYHKKLDRYFYTTA